MSIVASDVHYLRNMNATTKIPAVYGRPMTPAMLQYVAMLEFSQQNERVPPTVDEFEETPDTLRTPSPFAPTLLSPVFDAEPVTQRWTR